MDWDRPSYLMEIIQLNTMEHKFVGSMLSSYVCMSARTLNFLTSAYSLIVVLSMHLVLQGESGDSGPIGPPGPLGSRVSLQTVCRRIKSDLKMCFKIINGLCDPLHYFKFAPTSSFTRGHNIKLIKPICNTNCQLYFFTNRVVNYWNSLPADIVNASSFGIFVWKLNSHDLSGFCRGSGLGVSHETCSTSIISFTICYLCKCFLFFIFCNRKWCKVLNIK